MDDMVWFYLVLNLMCFIFPLRLPKSVSMNYGSVPKIWITAHKKDN